MKNRMVINWSRSRRIAFAAFCGALFLGAIIPLLVDFLINGNFSWSMIVLGAVAMAWLIIAPWFIFRRSRLMISCAAAAVTVPAFLWLVESFIPNKGWLLPLGLPAAAAGLAVLGGIVWIWNGSRLKFWYAAALTFILVGLMSLLEYILASPFMPMDPSESVRQGIALCMAGGSMLLTLIAWLVHGLKPLKDQRE
jgi:hypothetical protein